MTPAIEANHLSFAFERGQDVLTDITFRIDPCERVSVLGGNGAGKSTLVWCLAGLLRARGQLRLFGGSPASTKGRVGLVFQNPEDQLFMPSIHEDLVLPLINQGMAEADASREAKRTLDQVGLLECARRPASKLSYGQRKRAAIAATLVSRPEILILDEPTAELDGRSVRELQQLLGSLQCTLVVVTHDLGFAGKVTSRTLLLAGGTIIADGCTKDICESASLLEHAGIL